MGVGNNVIMNHPEMGAEARAREQRAREREARALAHGREAQRRADAATDPETAEAFRHEADVHARAAKVHRDAVGLQDQHAREHEA